MRLGHKPVCGLLESNYYLPLRFAPLELEFTIVSDPNEPIVVPEGDEQTNPNESDKEGYYFQAGNTSTKWELNNIIIRAEVITLDNTVENNITKHLLEGQSLKLIVPQYHTLTQTFNTGGGEISMNIVKSASKLSTAFITLYRQKRQGERYDGKFYVDNYVHKRYNYMYNPMINSEINDGPNAQAVAIQRGQGFQDYTRNLSYQCQISNKKYPEFECQSLSEAFYYLRRTLHYMNGDQNSLNISYSQYRSNKFIIGVSFEKMQDTSFTGTNTKMGSLIVFKIKATEGVLLEAEQIQEVFIHMISEAVLELTESGSIVYD